VTSLRLLSKQQTQDASGFTEAMRELASGVVLVTCEVEGRPWGMTVTAFASVSADPPTVLVSLRSDSTAAHAIAADGAFGVSILAEHHVDLARHLALPGHTKFLEPFVGPNRRDGSSPAVAGALAQLDCEVDSSVDVADHIVFFGRVRSATTGEHVPPLVYQRREYRSIAHPRVSASTRCSAS
jgi:flavin reductase (DIM6/NTAB) family NADH-FMN oxidoreductase RutF